MREGELQYKHFVYEDKEKGERGGFFLAKANAYNVSSVICGL